MIFSYPFDTSLISFFCRVYFSFLILILLFVCLVWPPTQGLVCLPHCEIVFQLFLPQQLCHLKLCFISQLIPSLVASYHPPGWWFLSAVWRLVTSSSAEVAISIRLVLIKRKEKCLKSVRYLLAFIFIRINCIILNPFQIHLKERTSSSKSSRMIWWFLRFLRLLSGR